MIGHNGEERSSRFSRIRSVRAVCVEKIWPRTCRAPAHDQLTLLQRFFGATHFADRAGFFSRS